MEFVRIYRLRGTVADFTDMSTTDSMIRVQFLDPSTQIDMPKEKWELFVNELAEAVKTFDEQDVKIDNNTENEDGE